MISDPKAKDSASLEEYYLRLRAAQVEAHGSAYLTVHDEIRALIEFGDCTNYAECGVNQGTTLALAILAGAHYVRGYDVDISRYKAAEPLFKEYIQGRGINFRVMQEDSLKVELPPVDLLYLDTKHTPRHVTSELHRHSGSVAKCIVIHDTNAPDLYPAIKAFCEHRPEWQVDQHSILSVGYTTLARLRHNP